MMHQQVCVCEKAECPADSGYFYATVINDSGDHRFLLGPFANHETAIASVGLAQSLAERMDARAFWYAYGTARTETAVSPLFVPCLNCGEVQHRLNPCKCRRDRA